MDLVQEQPGQPGRWVVRPGDCQPEREDQEQHHHRHARPGAREEPVEAVLELRPGAGSAAARGRIGDARGLGVDGLDERLVEVGTDLPAQRGGGSEDDLRRCRLRLRQRHGRRRVCVPGKRTVGRNRDIKPCAGGRSTQPAQLSATDGLGHAAVAVQEPKRHPLRIGKGGKRPLQRRPQRFDRALRAPAIGRPRVAACSAAHR